MPCQRFDVCWDPKQPTPKPLEHKGSREPFKAIHRCFRATANVARGSEVIELPGLVHSKFPRAHSPAHSPLRQLYHRCVDRGRGANGARTWKILWGNEMENLEVNRWVFLFCDWLSSFQSFFSRVSLVGWLDLYRGWTQNLKLDSPVERVERVDSCPQYELYQGKHTSLGCLEAFWLHGLQE